MTIVRMGTLNKRQSQQPANSACGSQQTTRLVFVLAAGQQDPGRNLVCRPSATLQKQAAMQPSPLPPQQLPSSHTSSTSLSHRAQQHRKTSADKPGLVKRNSSTSSLLRSTSSKNNVAAAAARTAKHSHPHVAHTSASKHHRTTSFGHRVPSYGKGLNKLTALTAAHPDDASKEHFSIHALVDRAQGAASMQRSLSEGNGMFLFPELSSDCSFGEKGSKTVWQ